MHISDQDKHIIEGTTRFFKALQEGRFIPDNVEQHLTDYVGNHDDFDINYQHRWEELIVGTIAHEASLLFNSFPVLILDYNDKTTRVSSTTDWKVQQTKAYVWNKNQRPKRPKAPHRIEDHTLVRIANKHMTESRRNDQVIHLPIIANFEKRSIFEIALIVVFPVWGAYAYRARVNMRDQYQQWEFKQMLEQRTDSKDDPLEDWIMKHLPQFTAHTREWWIEYAVGSSSKEAFFLIESLATKYRMEQQPHIA